MLIAKLVGRSTFLILTSLQPGFVRFSDHGTQHFIAKVTDIIELVNNVLMHDWSKISTLVPLVDRIYLILQK